MRVTIADCDVDLTQSLSAEFTAHGHEVQTASNSRQCLASLSEFIPDVLVLEGNLPDGGCEQVLKGMTEKPAVSHIPVIILPASESAPFSGLRYHNVVAWLRKPFQFDDLNDRIHTAVHSTEPSIRSLSQHVP